MDCFSVLLSHRGVLKIEGDEARSFLQGLITNDMTLVTPQNSIYTALLTPQGKFLHDFFISQRGESFFLECEKDRVEDLKKRLILYKLRSKITLADVSEFFKVYALIGDDVFAKLQLNPQAGKAQDSEGGKLYSDPRWYAMGARVLLPADKNPAFFQTLGFKEGEFALYETLRLQQGLPDGSRDMKLDRAIPLECGLEELRAISWTKGCYLGQELTSRTKYRGLVRKRLFPVTLEGAAPPVGTPLFWQGEEVGEMLSSLDQRGLIRLRLDIFAKLEKKEGTLTAETTTLFPYKPPWMTLQE